MLLRIERAFVCLISLIVSCSVSAQEKLRLVVPDLKPYTYAEGKHFEGIGVEWVTSALELIDQPYSLTLVPNHGRALAEVKIGRADGFFLATENEERNEVARLSLSVFQNNWSWFILKDGVSPREGSFKGKAKIGTLLNSNTHKWLTDEGYNVAITAKHPDKLLDMLKLKRIEAIFLSEAVFFEAFVQEDSYPEFDQYIEKTLPLGVYFSKTFLDKDTSFIDRFNRAVLALD